MTIPFEAGFFRESTKSVRVAARTGRPSAFGPGVSPFGALSRDTYVVVCCELGQAGTQPAGRRPFSRSAGVLSVGGYPPDTSRRRISAVCTENAVLRGRNPGDTPHHLSHRSRQFAPP